MAGLGEREVEMSEPEGSRDRPGGVEYERVGEEYMEQRRLQRGAAGWVLLMGLGIAYVISGEFAGWNFGLAEGGWGGLLIATVLMAVMYTAMVFALAELSTIIPTAGGGYAVGEALKLMFVITAIAVAALVVFVLGMIPQFDPANLFDIKPTDAAGASA